MAALPFTVQARDSVSVNITGATVYTDATLATPVTMPATITSDTTWYVSGTQTIQVTVTENGIAWGPIGTLIDGGATVVIDYPGRSLFDHDAPSVVPARPLNATAMWIYESGGIYPVRSTVTTSASQPVIWVGVDAPTIGGSYALNDIDLWYPTSV